MLRYSGIFIVSLVSVAYEIFLTRHFAVTNWSEYGYWIISIAMVGFSLSGVVICLFKDFFLKRHQGFFLGIPPAMMILAVLGYGLLNTIQFNPLELQNAVLWDQQLMNIGKCYLVLFPFFFASGMYVGLSFLVYRENIPTLYKADLIGAGLGALILLGAMFLFHPFHILAVILPLLWIGVPVNVPTARRFWRIGLSVGCLFLLAGAEWWLWTQNNSTYCQYKAMNTALNVENNQKVQEVLSPRGYYLLLKNFNERLDVDLSNNYELLGAGGPPAALGLYKDGDRISSFPRSGDYDLGYLKAALDAFPYTIRPGGQALLLGSRGGFRPREALALGAARVEVVEPDRTIYDLLTERRDALWVEGHVESSRVGLHQASPQAFVSQDRRRWDLIDISPEYLDQNQANKFTFTVEGFKELIGALSDRGLISVPVSISEFIVYAVKTTGTIREALLEMGLTTPERHIMVYRSTWNARILVSRAPFTPEDIERLRAFAADRSFDTSYFPGLDPATVQVWNDLPAVSFEDGTTATGEDGPRDALRDELTRLLLKTDQPEKSAFFNLAPSTHDRPFFYSILRPSKIGDILKKIDIIPRPEMGYLISLAVLFQAVVFALVVLFLPLLRRSSLGMKPGQVAVSIVYFLSLGLGFLFIEIVLIERFTFFLNDAVSAFALVLSAMLIFSGLGSGYSGRFVERPKVGVSRAVALVVVFVLILALGLPPVLNLAIHWPFWAKYLFIVLAVAPLSFVLGMPFPLGLSTLRTERAGFLPWAWSINGAFSVISTPLANILAVTYGYSVVLLAAGLLYLLAAATVPPAARIQGGQ